MDVRDVIVICSIAGTSVGMLFCLFFYKLCRQRRRPEIQPQSNDESTDESTDESIVIGQAIEDGINPLEIQVARIVANPIDTENIVDAELVDE